MQYTKHSMVTLAAIVILSILLTACGGGTNNKKADSANTEQASTKVYKDVNGEVEIPTNPQRIVSITHLGDLLALGVKPVGAGSLALENSVLLEKELEGVANVGDVSVEKVLELNPDLIIVPSYLPVDIVDQLKKIAPTVVLTSATLAGTDPLEEVRTFGDLLGREKEAEEFITRYKQKAEEAKTKISEVIGPDETIGTYSIWAKNLWVWPKTRDAGYNLFEMFGLTPQEKIAADAFPGGQGIDISLEVLPDYAADHMFFTVYEPSGGAERAQEVMEGPVWKNIPAVQKNQVYMLNYKEFWMVDGLNLEKQLDILVDIIVNQNK